MVSADVLAKITQEGKDAFLAGKPPISPYYEYTDCGKAWTAGYDAARGPLPKLGKLELPALVSYTPAHIDSRTSKLADGRFAAVGAIYFQGYRGRYVSAIGSTRADAERNVMAILDPDPTAAYRSESRLRAMGG